MSNVIKFPDICEQLKKSRDKLEKLKKAGYPDKIYHQTLKTIRLIVRHYNICKQCPVTLYSSFYSEAELEKLSTAGLECPK